MFDWKILAASFAALLVVSSVLVGGFGFTDVLGTLSEWMGNSPLGNMVSTPVKSVKQASITIYPESFDIILDKASFNASGASFIDFSGTVKANLTSDRIEFLQKDSDLKVSLELDSMTFDEIMIGRLSLEGTSFNVISSSLDTSGQNATLEILDFSGQVTISTENVHMDGNVSSVRGNGKIIV